MIDYEKGLIGSKKRLWPCPEGTDPAGISLSRPFVENNTNVE